MRSTTKALLANYVDRCILAVKIPAPINAVPPQRLNHDLRHTFASQLLSHGGDLKDVQELLGHKSMTMTLRYAHLTQEHKKKAVNLLNSLTGRHANDCHKTVTDVKMGISMVS